MSVRNINNGVGIMADYDLLIKLIDAVNLNDPVKNVRGCYKQGDIVEVRIPGTYGRGLEEWPPKFTMVHLTAAPDGLKVRYEMPRLDMGTIPPTTLAARVFRIDFSTLPAKVRNDLLSGYYEADWSVVKNYLRNKTTGLTE